MADVWFWLFIFLSSFVVSYIFLTAVFFIKDNYK